MSPNKKRSGGIPKKKAQSAVRARASGDDPESSSQTAKGRVVEKIVASMLERPDVQIERNRKLPVPQSQLRRRREIDVLVTARESTVAPPLAIECKNESKPIGTPKIDGFVARLADLGLTGPAAYVSARGYKANAVERALAGNVRPYVLTGLDASGRPIWWKDAIQASVVLVPRIAQIQVENDVAATLSSAEMLVLHRDTWDRPVLVADLVWDHWLSHRTAVAFTPAEYTWTLRTDGVSSSFAGLLLPVRSIRVKIDVVASMVLRPGRYTRHELVRADSHTIDHFQIEAEFDEQPIGEVPIVHSEAELTALLQARGALRLLTDRVMAPRLEFMSLCYWPPSTRLLLRLSQLQRDTAASRVAPSAQLNIRDLEGTALNRLWDPVATDYPFLGGLQW